MAWSGGKLHVSAFGDETVACTAFDSNKQNMLPSSKLSPETYTAIPPFFGPLDGITVILFVEDVSAFNVNSFLTTEFADLEDPPFP